MNEQKSILAQAYSNTADALYERMKEFAKSHPEVYGLKSPWDLFGLGFKCGDLQPSLYQASWALGKLKAEQPK